VSPISTLTPTSDEHHQKEILSPQEDLSLSPSSNSKKEQRSHHHLFNNNHHHPFDHSNQLQLPLNMSPCSKSKHDHPHHHHGHNNNAKSSPLLNGLMEGPANNNSTRDELTSPDENQVLDYTTPGGKLRSSTPSRHRDLKALENSRHELLEAKNRQILLKHWNSESSMTPPPMGRSSSKNLANHSVSYIPLTFFLLHFD